MSSAVTAADVAWTTANCPNPSSNIRDYTSTEPNFAAALIDLQNNGCKFFSYNYPADDGKAKWFSTMCPNTSAVLGMMQKWANTRPVYMQRGMPLVPSNAPGQLLCRQQYNPWAYDQDPGTGSTSSFAAKYQALGIPMSQTSGSSSYVGTGQDWIVVQVDPFFFAFRGFYDSLY